MKFERQLGWRLQGTAFGGRAQGTFRMLLILGLVLITAAVFLLLALKFSGMLGSAHSALEQVVR